MSENQAAEVSADTPIFSLQKIYIKDTSFENPNSPEIFTTASGQPKITMNLAVNHRQLDAEHWEVSLKVSAITLDVESEKLLFEVEVEHGAVFYMKNIEQEHIPMILAVDCPTIIFPYTRQIISQLTVDGGFMPLLLEPVNFKAVYDNSQINAEGSVH